jgi:hypothetical protein
MPIELFGFRLGRKKTNKTAFSSNKPQNVKSFVAPDKDEGATYVDGGGHFGSYIDFETKAKNEREFIGKYREMAVYPEVESAVEDICNESIVTEDGSKNINVILDNTDLSDNIKDKIYEEFDYVYNLLDFHRRGFEIFRKWYIDGRLYYHMIVDEKKLKKGIQEVRYVEPLKIKKVIEIDKETNEQGVSIVKSTDEYFVYQEDESQAEGIKIAPEAISYTTSGLYDSSNQRVISYLHKAMKSLNQLSMIEDAVVIYRIARAPERRIFYIDVGNLPKTKAEQYVRSLMNKYRNKLVYDASTGEIRDDRRHMSMLEDYWLPRREGGKGTEISTLDGGQNLGEMEDVEYFQKKVYQALNVPVTRMQLDEGFSLGRATEITRDELKFQRFIDRLRNKFNGLFSSLLKTQCLLKGIMSEEEWDEIDQNIGFEYASDNHFTELKEYEIINERMTVLREVNDYIGQYYSVEWVRKNILRQSDEEIKEMDKQISKEREAGIITDEPGGY